MTGDVIVVQVGDSGTYTGAHFWNIQNEIVSLYEGNRTGEEPKPCSTRNGYYSSQSLFYETAERGFHPRAIWIDAKGSIRRVEKSFEVQDGDEGVEWEGDVDRYCQSGSEGGNGVFEYFGDYLTPKIDTKKTMHIVDGVWRNPRKSDHRMWSNVDGECLVRQPDVEEIEDSIRRVAERSDSLAGFMFFVDDTTLWGNMTSQILENMQHDYAGKSKVVFATREACDETRLTLLEGLATSCISPLVDMYVPMVDPVVQNPILAARESHPRHSLFQNSLLKAVGIHAAMAPCHRTDDSRLDIHSLIGLVTGTYNSPFASMDMIFPATRVRKDDSSSSSSSRTTLFSSDTRVSFNQDHILGSDADHGRFAESISILHHEAEISHDAVLARIQNDTVRRVQSVSWSDTGIPHLPYMIPFAENTDSLGAICRLCGTTSFQKVLESLSASFKKAAASSMGSRLVASWGVSREHVIEAYNDLQSLAGTYIS
ncbi:hypothetical protein M9435_005243 [Picochlorum sp. BPE23]|nr:hypothetical protein M9435_005243 [Picochlorum sp. BPE23]